METYRSAPEEFPNGLEWNPAQGAGSYRPLSPADPQATPSRESAQEFYLQAGSFRKLEQAEKRRVQLLLLNTNAEIKKVRHDGKSWYRLQTGPYHSSSQVASVRDKLLGEGIDTLVTSQPRP